MFPVISKQIILNLASDKAGNNEKYKHKKFLPADIMHIIQKNPNGISKLLELMSI